MTANASLLASAESHRCQKIVVVPQARLERALLSEQDFESSASTIPPLGHIFDRPTRLSGRSSNRASALMQVHPYFFISPIS